jgi:putative lipase involved disintegration of autophagic bodies
MYALAEEHILSLINQYDEKAIRRRSGLSHGSTSMKTVKKKRLFITGHSLGGALGTSK